MREVSRSAKACRPAVSKLKKTQALFPALTRLDMCKAYGVTAEHLPQLARMVPAPLPTIHLSLDRLYQP